MSVPPSPDDTTGQSSQSGSDAPDASVSPPDPGPAAAQPEQVPPLPPPAQETPAPADQVSPPAQPDAAYPTEQLPPPPQGYPTANEGYAQAPSPAPGYPPAQGYPPAGYQQQAAGYAKPDNYLVWAILTTILCCMPLGIVSIVYSTQVDSKWNVGDYAGAEASSQSARTWAIWSGVVGIAFTVLIALLFVVLPLLGFLPLLFMSDTGTSTR